MRTAASVLTIIGGILGIVFGGLAAAGLGIASMISGFSGLAAIGAGLLALGIIALIGGIMMRRKQHWGFCLAGAICAMFPIVPLGVLAIIFIAITKREFS